MVEGNMEQPVDGSPDVSPEESLGTKVSQWIFRASVVGIAVSLLVHATLALIFALVWLDRPEGSPQGGPKEVEFAVVTQQELTDLRLTLPDEVLAIDDFPELEMVGSPDLEGPIPEPQLASLDPGQISPLGGAADGLGDGMDAAVGGAASSASFFGVEARGSRFIYIVDVSGSMAGPKIEALRRELVNSIDGLLEHSSFQVLFYSSNAHLIGSKTRWLSGNERHKSWASREIRAVPAYGGTEPLPAFEIAFRMKPRPDAIYFMTDGLFDSRVASVVMEFNEQGRRLTPIHCISFVSQEAEKLLRQMASQSGGTYTHVVDPNL